MFATAKVGALHLKWVFLRFQAEAPWLLKLGFATGVVRVRPLFCCGFGLSRLLLLVPGVTLAEPFPREALLGLGSPKYSDRQQSEFDLLEWGRGESDCPKDEILEQFRLSDDPEVRCRCLNVLKKLVTDDYSKQGKGYIGVSLSGELFKLPQAAKPQNVIRVTAVQPNTPAFRAGIVAGDLIVGIGAEVWGELDAVPRFLEKVASLKPGTNLSVKVHRNGVISELKVTLVRRPSALDDLRFFEHAATDYNLLDKAPKEAYFQQWLKAKGVTK